MMLVMLNQNSQGMYMVLLISFLLCLKDESSLIAIVMGSLVCQNSDVKNCFEVDSIEIEGFVAWFVYPWFDFIKGQ